MKKFLISIVVLLSVAVPPTASAQTTTEATYEQQLQALVVLLQEKLALLQSQLLAAAPSRELTVARDISVESLVLADDARVVAQYNISDASDVDDIDNQTHRAYFGRFADLVPREFHTRFDEFVVYGDVSGHSDAFVETTFPYNVERDWRLGLNKDLFIYDAEDLAVSELFIHEFGHVVAFETYGENQRRIGCHDYFQDGFGCIDEDTILSQFINVFWSNQDLSRLVRQKQRYDLHTIAANTYRERPSEFVSEYAASVPEEDFAESFATFVLTERPTGKTVRDQKVQFFYDFDELVDIRSDIRSNL